MKARRRAGSHEAERWLLDAGGAEAWSAVRGPAREGARTFASGGGGPGLDCVARRRETVVVLARSLVEGVVRCRGRSGWKREADRLARSEKRRTRACGTSEDEGPKPSAPRASRLADARSSLWTGRRSLFLVPPPRPSTNIAHQSGGLTRCTSAPSSSHGIAVSLAHAGLRTSQPPRPPPPPLPLRWLPSRAPRSVRFGFFFSLPPPTVSSLRSIAKCQSSCSVWTRDGSGGSRSLRIDVPAASSQRAVVGSTSNRFLHRGQIHVAGEGETVPGPAEASSASSFQAADTGSTRLRFDGDGGGGGRGREGPAAAAGNNEEDSLGPGTPTLKKDSIPR